MSAHAWYAKKGSGGQGLVIDEITGANIAVAYDEQHTALLAAAPKLLAALHAASDYMDSEEGPGARRVRNLIEDAIVAAKVQS